ncbi:hypothetical protein N7528_004679 [Penicillium herquei]|nr:hypothetical protein N7528_004679 [Penicillium herquei]
MPEDQSIRKILGLFDGTNGSKNSSWRWSCFEYGREGHSGPGADADLVMVDGLETPAASPTMEQALARLALLEARETKLLCELNKLRKE